ncbi:MAG TPA: hypothetical protein VMV18_02470 [bacterium]|nr:hypothetical protein [bacterium]
MTHRTLTLTAAAVALGLAAGCGPGSRTHRQAISQYGTGGDASSYAQDTANPNDYSASQATGAPDVSACGDDPLSWAPASAQPNNPGADDYLDVTFDRYVFVSDVRITESYNPGGIVEVDLIATDGSAPDAIVFQDPTGDGAAAGCPTVFHIGINQGTTDDQYNRVRVWIDSDIVGDANGDGNINNDWNEIDAIELDGDELVR